MGLFDKKKLKEAYTEEMKKQTDSYEYYCLNEKIKRGEQQDLSCPPFCIVENLHEMIFDNSSDDNNKLFEDKSYVLLQKSTSKYEFVELNNELTGSNIIDVIYWDSDRITGDKRHTPFFKPDYSPDTLISSNYMGESYIVSVELTKKVLEVVRNDSAAKEYTEDVLRYDFLLRLTEKAKTIRHVSKILEHIEDDNLEDINVYAEYTWKNQSSEYVDIRNNALKRRGIPFTYEIVGEKNNDVINNTVIKPDIAEFELSVIIPSKNHSEILMNCLNSIKECFSKDDEKKLEIIVVDNGSNEEEKSVIEEFIEEYNKEISISYIYEPMEFNYSMMCNIGAKNARYDMLLFLNDDIELISDTTFERMYVYAALKRTGAVGAKLYYPNGVTIQHVGVTVDLDCGPTHKLATYSDDKSYYYGWNIFNKNVLALTGACLMVSREKYFKVGCFSDKMGVSYNDVDLCVKLHEKGHFNVLLNECILFHHESLSRGMDSLDDAKYVRLKNERHLLYEEHPFILKTGDPFYNRNLIKDTLGYSVNVVPDYDKRGLMSKTVDDSDMSKLIKKRIHKKDKDNNNKHLNFNIEACSFERGIMKDAEDYYVIEGWAILQKKDNAFFDIELAFANEDECRIFTTFKKAREDVAIVFANEKNACLSGFVCKIPVSMLEKDKKYTMAIIKKSNVTGKKYNSLCQDFMNGTVL